MASARHSENCCGTPGAERVTVGAFESADVAGGNGGLTGERALTSVSALMDRTGGDPFYTTELVRLVSIKQRHRPLTAGDRAGTEGPQWHPRRPGAPGLPSCQNADRQSLLMVAAVGSSKVHPELLSVSPGWNPSNCCSTSSPRSPLVW